MLNFVIQVEKNRIGTEGFVWGNKHGWKTEMTMVPNQFLFFFKHAGNNESEKQGMEASFVW